MNPCKQGMPPSGFSRYACYRVRSPRGIQFRQWASTHLKEFLIKGFAIDDERAKNPGGWDYSDELLDRIRSIRASDSPEYYRLLESVMPDWKNQKLLLDSLADVLLNR